MGTMKVDMNLSFGPGFVAEIPNSTSDFDRLLNFGDHCHNPPTASLA